MGDTVIMKIVDVIKYEGPNDIFVWKFPGEDFNTLSQLIVHESQEAVFFKDGQALDVFGPGRYTLHSQNIPVLRRLINLPFSGESPFHCEVYFINKTVSMDIAWDTPRSMLIQDAVYKIILPINSRGQFAVKVADSKKLLIKLVGTISVFSQDTIKDYFAGILLTNIKDYIASEFVKEHVTFLEIQSHLKNISSGIATQLQDEFDKYGLELVNFYVYDISPNENDPSYKQLKNALAKKAEMSVMGYNYQQERTFNVLDKAASNESDGSNLMNAGIGLGMGMGAGGMIFNAIENAGTNINPQEVKAQSQAPAQNKCPKCGAVIPEEAKFCPECGEKIEKRDKDQPEPIKCPNCGKMVPKGKFCLECGYKFPLKCPKCGAELSDGAKFCFECGAKIE